MTAFIDKNVPDDKKPVAEEIATFLQKKIEEFLGEEFKFVLAIEHPGPNRESRIALLKDISDEQAVEIIDQTRDILRKRIAADGPTPNNFVM